MQAGPEMASPKSLVEKRINSIPGYVNEFKNVYGDNVKIDFEKITSTIAIFSLPSTLKNLIQKKA
jgi:cytochrome c peroxidase